MIRTPEQVLADYMEFRGRCKELSEQAIAQDPSLTLVRGHYYCPLWGTNEAHWWCITPNGKIVDPSARQFPSNGGGIYTPFDGTVECSECGKSMKEEEARFDSNYVFCSTACHMRFVGL